MKNYIVLTRDGKPVKMLEVKSIKETSEVLALKKECEDNAKCFEKADKEQQECLTKKYIEALNRISVLEHKVKIIEAELKFNRGEIEESEYLEICNGNK